MYLLRAINSDRQTRLLNVLGQIAVYWEGGKNYHPIIRRYVFLLLTSSVNKLQQYSQLIIYFGMRIMYDVHI